VRAWLGLLILAASTPCQAIKVERLQALSPAGQPSGPAVEVVSEQVFVRFSTFSAPEQQAAVLKPWGASLLSQVPSIGWTLVGLPAGMPVRDGISFLRAVPGAEAVQANYVYRPNRTPSDPLVNSQYALSQVNAFGAWEFETGGSNVVTVAVVDSGIDGTHPDLSVKLASTTSQFCDPGPNKETNDDTACVASADATVPACNHATRVAGVAAASSDNSVAVAGMSWGAQLLSLKVFRNQDCTVNCGDNGLAKCGTDDFAVANALIHAGNLHAAGTAGKIVVNLSLGGEGSCSSTAQTAITNAVSSGVVVVAAAGNDGGAINTPANCVGVIPVGATDSNNNVASFSSRGAELAANGLVAPGVSVLTTDAGGGTAQATGTSFAAPYVAGLAALIKAAKPALTPAEVQSALRGGAEGIGLSSLGLDAGGRPAGNSTGAGRMNAFRSMRLAVKGTLADFEGDQKAIAFPNPFRTAQSGNVSFTVPLSLQGTSPKVKIYTANGEFVRELTGLTWDGKNKEGKLVASGTYIFVVSTGAGRTRGRVAVIR
jgi:serine protease